MKDTFGGLVSAFGSFGVKSKKNSGRAAPVQDLIKSMAKLPPNVTEGVTNTISQITDYLSVAEQEKTKRTEIIAKRDIALAAMQNQRDAFMEMMRLTFQERAAVLQKQFEALDYALANGNVEAISASLNAMVSIIQTSPFKNVQEMQKSLGSQDFVIRLE